MEARERQRGAREKGQREQEIRFGVGKWFGVCGKATRSGRREKETSRSGERAGHKTVWRLWKKQRGAEEEGRKSEGKRLAADLFWCGGKPGKAGTQWVCDRKWLTVRVCEKGRVREEQGKRSRAADAKANSGGSREIEFYFSVPARRTSGEGKLGK